MKTTGFTGSEVLLSPCGQVRQRVRVHVLREWKAGERCKEGEDGGCGVQIRLLTKVIVIVECML